MSVHFRDRDGPGSYDGFHVHEKLAVDGRLDRVVRHEDEWFVLDVFRAADPAD